METTRLCPQCQQSLAADAPSGLCPQCLLKAAAGPPPSASGIGLASDIIDIGDPAEVAKKLPQFEILEMLGRGGMGVVYKARQRNLDRIVALKILPPIDATSPDFVARFTREARALAKLNHPNIVNVHDFGETGGLYYIIMEYVDGANLRQVLQTRRLAPAEALAIVPKICDALEYAHEEGLVHRDIKPENLLIDKKGRVKIADFGLAKLLRREPLDMTLTLSGMALGTLRYMAPEQMDKPESVDHRADLYSLGVVIYEMLTGETPVGRFELPSQKAQVDVRLDDIVLHALEKEPARRYQHASEVRDDVEKVTSKPQVAPVAATKSEAVLLLDEVDRTARRRQQQLSILGALFLLAGAWEMAVLSLAPVAIVTWLGSALAIVVSFRTKQQCVVEYLGHSIQIDNTLLAGCLMIDGKTVASGAIGPGTEFSGRISSGAGAGDRIIARHGKGFLSYRCQLWVEPKNSLPSASPDPRPTNDAEDAEEEAEAEHPIFAWVWKFVALAAVILAFFNPWGAKAWYYFAAFCAIAGVLKSFVPGRQRTSGPQPTPRHNLETLEPQPVSPPQGFHWLLACGALLLGWVIVGALWNFRTPGCVTGALIMSGILMDILLRRARRIPQWLAAWKNAGIAMRVYFLSGFLLSATLGFIFLISAMMLRWETARFHWNSSVVPAEVFEAQHKGKEHQLIRGLDAFKESVPTTELTLHTVRQSWGLYVWGGSTPSLGIVNSSNVVLLMFLGALLVMLLAQMYFAAEKISVWRWNTRTDWLPAAALTATVLASTALAYGVLFYLQIFQIFSGKVEAPFRYRAVAASVEQVDAAVNRWAAANGYATGDIQRWTFDTVPQGNQVAKIEIADAWKPSPFDRWQMTSLGWRRISPHIAFQITGTDKPLQSFVSISPGDVMPKDSPQWIEWERELSSVDTAVEKAGGIDLAKPDDSSTSAKASGVPNQRDIPPWFYLVGVVVISVLWAWIRVASAASSSARGQSGPVS